MEKQFDEIYFSLLGDAVEPIPGINCIFAPGTECESCLYKIQTAYDNLRRRLCSQDEDPDVETILSASLYITEMLCRKIYEYGAKHEEK